MRHGSWFDLFITYWTARAHRLDQQFLRYLLVGGVATLGDYGTLVLSVSGLQVHYLLGNAAGFTVGLAINYALSIGWVFPWRVLKSPIAEFALFAGIGIVGLGLSELIMFAGVDLLGWHYTLAKIAAVAGTLLWNFTVRRALLFSGPRTDTQQRKDAPA